MKYLRAAGALLGLVYLLVFGPPSLWVTMHAEFLYWPVLVLCVAGTLEGVIGGVTAVRGNGDS